MAAPPLIMTRLLELLGQQQTEEARRLAELTLSSEPGDATLWGLLGVIHGMRGEPREAERCAREAIHLKPDYPEAHNNLGLALQLQERHEEAISYLREAIRLRPGYADAYYNMGNALKAVKRMEEAAECYREALQRRPQDSGALINLGVTLAALDRHDEAMVCYQQALQIDPASAMAQNNLGAIYASLNRPREALHHYRRAIELKPGYAEAYNNLANALADIGKPREALTSYQRAIGLKPDYVEGHNNLGLVCAKLGLVHEATTAYRRAIELKPDFADAYNNFGVLLTGQGNHEEAIAYYQRAIGLKPDFTEAYNNLGAALQNLGCFVEALAAFQQALGISPNHATTLRNLGGAFLALGKHDEALEYYGRALIAGPDDGTAHRARLAAMLYHPGLSADRIYAEHRDFEKKSVLPLYAFQRPHVNSKELDRRLRIGFISSDIRNHPVARSLMPLFEAIDRNRYEIFLYAEVNRSDKVTEYLRHLADGWRPTVGLDDASVAEMIRNDSIDILVCLAGHFDKNRLLVCAYKPAPILVSYHDVVTSGLSAVDYLITDILLSPRNSTERFTETLIRLPTFHLQVPFTNASDVSAPPSVAVGDTTFGSFNSPSKLTPQVMALWARALISVPKSRLLLKYMGHYADEGLRQRILDEFASHGIEPDRLILDTHRSGILEHLDAYKLVDIALDTFPFNGSTTTFEALWMGVPVITLEGRTMVSRWGISMLTRAGLPELVARNEDQFVEIARNLAADLPQLMRLRAGLRERVARSPLCNVRARTRQIERAFRYMWRKWCRSG